MRVGFDDVLREIVARSDSAKARLAWWRRKYASIAPAVEGFVHERLFEISSRDVVATLDRGIHALGELSKSDELKVVEDVVMPPTAVQDLFHRYVELYAALPTWPEFRAFLREPLQNGQLLDPWWRALLRELPADMSRDRAGKAIQWRLGKMYYSNLREVDMLSRLREQFGISLKYHVFADVRLGTDFWLGDANVSVFLSNMRYRGQGQARKHKAEKLLGDATPPFRFLEVEFPNLRDFGRLYRVSDEALALLAGRIRDH